MLGILLVMILALFLIPGTARADSTAPDTGITVPSSGFTMASPAIAGDIVYDLRASALGYGPSYTLGTFGKDQMMSIKGMWVVFPDPNIPNKLGAGLSVSIPKALKAAGVQNIPDWFTLEVGVLGLVDFNTKIEVSAGLYATLINVPIGPRAVKATGAY